MTHNRRVSIQIVKFFDIASVVFSFVLAAAVVAHLQDRVPISAFLSMRAKILNFVLFLFILSAYHVVFCIFGLYRSRRMSTLAAELLDIFKANLCGAVCLVAIGFACSIKMLTPLFLFLFFGGTAAILTESRIILRKVLARLRLQGKNLRYVLILGTNRRAIDFVHRIMSSPERGYHLLGFVDEEWPGLKEFQASGLQLVSSYSDLPEYLRHNVVDEAIIYLPLASFFRHWSGVERLFAQHGITVRLNSDIFDTRESHWITEEFNGTHSLSTLVQPGEGWEMLVKRTIDIGFAAFLLIILWPFLVLVALAIKLSSPGPIFFQQERIGLNKRRFKIWKFRTMVPNAERMMSQLESRNEVSGPVFKIKNDPRITPIGKLLRRTSIDELPQLFNVLHGDMSLVGPRPLPVRDYEGFSEDWQRRRFSVKPGITCLWQINGRSGVSFDQWMLLDLEYMDRWSLWLDLEILVKTVPAVLKGSGAA